MPDQSQYNRRLTPEEIESLQRDKTEKLAAASRAFDRMKAEKRTKQEATDAST